MRLAALRRPARWVKRLARKLFPSPAPVPAGPSVAIAPIEGLLGEARTVLAALALGPNDSAALRAYQVLRHRLCQALLTCHSHALRFLAGHEVFRLFIEPIYKDVDLLPEERSLHNALPSLLDALPCPGEQHTRRLLASMLYYQPYQLDDRHLWPTHWLGDPVLFPTLFRYLTAMEYNYTQVGEADRHARFLEAVLARLAELCETGPVAGEAILSAFAQHIRGAMRFCNTSSLKRFFVLKRHFRQLLLDRQLRGANLVPLKAFAPGQGKRRIGLLRWGYTQEFDFLMAPLSLLPSNRWEVHVFALSDDGLESAAARYPHFHPHRLVPGDVAASVNVIRRAAPDVLINGAPLGGDFHELPAAILMTRVAPVQVMYCSDISTSGIAALDYFIVGDVYWREGLTEEFTEQLVSCPGLGYCFPRQAEPVDREAGRAALGLGADVTLHVASAHLFKLTPELLLTWGRLLKDDRRARLALLPLAADYMRPGIRRLRRVVADVCREAGVAPEQMLVLEIQGRQAVSGVLAAADVYLDCFPYSGPTSALEALLAGIPVVTLAGSTFRGTFVAGMLQTISLEGCIAATPDEYVGLAQRLAGDGPFRQEVCRRLREHLPGARFLAPQLVAGDLEAVLSKLVPRGQGTTGAISRRS